LDTEVEKCMELNNLQLHSAKLCQFGHTV